MKLKATKLVSMALQMLSPSTLFSKMQLAETWKITFNFSVRKLLLNSPTVVQNLLNSPTWSCWHIVPKYLFRLGDACSEEHQNFSMIQNGNSCVSNSKLDFMTSMVMIKKLTLFWFCLPLTLPLLLLCLRKEILFSNH